MVNYVVNYKYIVKNECINRKKPQQNCNGKCFLEKELAKTEKQSQQTTVKSNSIDVFVTNEILVFHSALSKYFLKNIQFSELKDQPLSSFIADIFHPPLV